MDGTQGVLYANVYGIIQILDVTAYFDLPYVGIGALYHYFVSLFEIAHRENMVCIRKTSAFSFLRTNIGHTRVPTSKDVILVCGKWA